MLHRSRPLTKKFYFSSVSAQRITDLTQNAEAAPVGLTRLETAFR